MKYISKIAFAIILSLTIFSCDNNDESTLLDLNENAITEMSEAESAMFFKQNISIFDATIRNINENQYVKELYLANFSDKDWDKTEIGFDGMLFQDNGKGNDLIASDQIFTSVMKFDFNEIVIYDKNISVKSVMNIAIISPEFKHNKDLELFSSNYIRKNTTSNPNFAAKPRASISCDVELCSNGCIADWIWSGFGCVCVSNCSVTIGF